MENVTKTSGVCRDCREVIIDDDLGSWYTQDGHLYSCYTDGGHKPISEPADKVAISERADVERDVNARLVRLILEAMCERDGLSTQTDVHETVANYVLATRLGISHVYAKENFEDIQ